MESYILLFKYAFKNILIVHYTLASQKTLPTILAEK